MRAGLAGNPRRVGAFGRQQSLPEDPALTIHAIHGGGAREPEAGPPARGAASAVQTNRLVLLGFFAVLLAAWLGGPVGAFLAVPLLLVIQAVTLRLIR